MAVFLVFMCSCVDAYMLFPLCNRSMKKNGYLFEAKYYVDEDYVPRGSVVSYRYAVQQQRGNTIEEIATRCLQISFDNSQKGR